MENQADPYGPGLRRRANGALAVNIAMFFMGAVAGLGLTFGFDTEFCAGLVMVGGLIAAMLQLSRLAERTDKRLIAGESSYRAFFEHAVEGIFRTTPDGHYLAVNPALAEIYGYPSAAALIARFTDIGQQLYVDPKRRREFRALMQAHDVVTDFVSEIYHSSGKKIWISENSRAVRDWSGTLVCYEGTVEDVTEKFEAERKLRAALRQAELANHAKAAFLAAMSHELKTPLNAVLGFSEIIRDEILGAVGQKAYRDYAADIHAGGERLLALINDILDVSRLEGGAVALDCRICDLITIAEQAILQVRGTTGDARAVAVDFPPDLPAVNVDPLRLRQALGNLLSNALKFTPPGGTVSLSAAREPGGGVWIAVRDTGIGMAPEKIAAALEPFRQLDGSLARKFEGVGLGLSITKSLTELHGGKLHIESAMGAGTAVTIMLPVSRTQLRTALAG